jgi:hypothetical protein
MLTMAPCDAVVGFERSVYYRERAAAMYSSMPYSAAQAIVEVRAYMCCNQRFASIPASCKLRIDRNRPRS